MCMCDVNTPIIRYPLAPIDIHITGCFPKARSHEVSSTPSQYQNQCLFMNHEYESRFVFYRKSKKLYTIVFKKMRSKLSSAPPSWHLIRESFCEILSPQGGLAWCQCHQESVALQYTCSGIPHIFRSSDLENTANEFNLSNYISLL